MSLSNMNRLLGLLTRAADRRKPCEPVIVPYESKPSYKKMISDQTLLRVKPEERGMSSGQIAAFLRELRAEPATGIESVLVAKEDAILCEAVFGLQRPGVWKASFSQCKSLVAMAIGFLWDEGLLRTEERIGDIFRDKVNPLQRLSLGAVTVYELLTMQSLAIFNEGESNVSQEWIRDFFGGGALPGKKFQYNSMNSYMLSAIVREKAGCGLWEYLEKRLFVPLGIKNVYFEKSPEGIEKGGWGLYILPEDMVKIGLLLANHGVWQEKQILSSAWIDRMTKAHVTVEERYGAFDYGLHIWVGREKELWLVNGMFGQNMLIDPQRKLVVTINASNSDLFQTNPMFDIFERIFYVEKEWENCDLDALLASLHSKKEAKAWWKRFFTKEKELPVFCYDLAHTQFVPTRRDATLGVMPRMMQILENQYTTGLTALSFEVRENRFFVVFEEDSCRYPIPIGFGEGEEGRLQIGNTEWLIAGAGRFGYDEDMRLVLILEIDFLETPFHRYFRFYFSDEKMELRGDEAPGKSFVVRFVETMGQDILEKPIVRGLMEKLDIDILDYKLDVMFRPKLRLEKTKETPKVLKD